eukprot:TRINITY_DN4073_c0_g1_i1.p1 TRINITY_DN4073_c0_g1~~TRINITY_DN4073_c0_g1_i1.p1  ORF type:complete len:204 (+),score=13.67 TRINITY_DN4073_c0_g1_i1:53-664(+)
MISPSDQNTWLKQYELEDTSWQNKYAHAYYYITVTINTVGYGDIVPQNHYERFFSIVFMYIACTLFGYFFKQYRKFYNRIGSKIINFSLRNEYHQQLYEKKNILLLVFVCVSKNTLNTFYSPKKVSLKLRKHRSFQKLSPQLQGELIRSSYESILKSAIPIIYTLFSEEITNKLPFMVQEVPIPPNELIFRKDCCDDKAIYIV